MEDFHDYLEARRAEIEAALVAALPAPPECPASVASAMRYSVTAGGKRLRPILCLASAEAVGGDRTLAMPAACALEFIHTYSLIHDDLPAMDNDTMRRGRPTLHVVAGEGIAILAGDGLLTEAFALMAREPATADLVLAARKLRVIGVVAAAAGATGMVGGQALDLSASRPDRTDRPALLLAGEDLRMMHARKTGALIRAAAVAGVIMGGADDRFVQSIDAAAAELGLAFQIIDDVLDVEGVSASLGKTAGKDAAAGKATYAALYGIDGARRMATACLDRADGILREAGLGGTRLSEIGRWIVNRSH
ncbi:MAG: polyprenyl synthetase family protein [Acidobacteria bacterium]|nr:polyprenyl synthetase family protein [Acidobacteriota bacterium]